MIKPTPIFMAAVLLAGAPVLARPPADVADLVGAKGAGGEQELGSRGYSFIKSAASSGGNYAYWWNPRMGLCIRVLTADGRYQQIATATPADCDQRAANTNKHSDPEAAALYDRGYQDAIDGRRIQNNGEEYVAGYNSGVTERDSRNTSNRGNSGGSYGRISNSELEAMRGRSTGEAFAELGRRGFEPAKNPNNTLATFWNAANEQCISVSWRGTTVEGAYDQPRQSCF
mgnify:FL=1